MRIDTLTNKTLLAFFLIVLVATGSAIIVVDSLGQAEDDAEIVNALGRQRMLSQAMAKSILGYAIAKNTKNHIQEKILTLDGYITQMRKVYTKYVTHNYSGEMLQLSQAPYDEKALSLPFPATFTRSVNEALEQDLGVSIDIIAENPVNPAKHLQTAIDRQANSFLQRNPDKVFTQISSDDGELHIYAYTADKATTEACIGCHIPYFEKRIKPGDLLGIRKYKLLYSKDIHLGKAELNANLVEYDNARDIFWQTLLPMKNGGGYPANLQMNKYRTIKPLSTNKALQKIQEIEQLYSNFTVSVAELLQAKVGSLAFRQARQSILTTSNQLRKSSDDLVNIATAIAAVNQQRIFWSVLIMVGLIIVMVFFTAVFLGRAVTRPLKSLSNTLIHAAETGDFSERLETRGHDEVNDAMDALNQLLESIQSALSRTNSAMKKVANGNFSVRIEDDFNRKS